MSLRLWFSTLSDVGLVRTKNDDSAYAGPRLLAVADGMGGPPGGDIASALTIDALRELDITSPADQPEREAERLTEATLLANNRISARVDSESRLHGMGTTLTAALFTGDALVFGHIGDSRAYLYRPADRVVADDGTPADATAPPLVQLTKDHSFVQSLVDEGQITPEQAETHSHRSWLIRAVDGRPDNEPDTFFVDLVPGDRVLLCSDGLTGFVAIDAIREALAEAEGPEQACERLVALALDAGAPDNVTCVVAVVLEVDGDEAGQVVAVDTLDAQHPMLVGAVANLMGDDSGEITMTAPSEAVGMGHDGDGTSHARHSTEDDEADRYAPQPRSRWRWLRRVGIVVAAVALLVVAGALGYRWTQQQYYVGAASATEPTVAVYKGISQPMSGVHLSTVFETTDLALADLPTYQRDMVSQTISARSLEDARDIVVNLQTIAERCAVQASPTPTPTPAATPKATPGSTPKPTPKATPSITATATVTPSPTPTSGPDDIPFECAGVQSTRAVTP